nr:hypothetical protein CFP56_66867 [Quercus suber]
MYHVVKLLQGGSGNKRTSRGVPFPVVPNTISSGPTAEKRYATRRSCGQHLVFESSAVPHWFVRGTRTTTPRLYGACIGLLASRPPSSAIYDLPCSVQSPVNT